MGTVIDYTAFPDIVDAIIEACSVDALLSLRLVARSFHARIDSFLFHHVDLDITPVLQTRSYTMALRTRLDLYPDRRISLPFMPELVHVADISSLVPHLPLAQSPSIQQPRNRRYYSHKLRPYGCILFEVGLALDLLLGLFHYWWTHRRTSSGSALQEPVLGIDRLSSIHTVRRIGPGYLSYGVRLLNPTTMVDYLDFHPTSGRFFPVMDFSDGKHTELVFFPPQLQRYVLHIRLDDHSTILEGRRSNILFLLDLREQLDFRECRIVIHPPMTTQARVLVQLVHLNRRLQTFRLWHDRGKVGSFKYVGFDSFERAAAGATGTEEELGYLERGMAGMAQDVLQFGSLTMDEWLEELGDKREVEDRWISREASPSGG